MILLTICIKIVKYGIIKIGDDMDINQENINEILNKYINFTNNLSLKYNYLNNIRHVLYLIIPAFVIKYGIREERSILSCFENIPIYITDKSNSSYIAYFNRRLASKLEDGLTKFYSIKEVVINNYYDSTLIDLIDSLVHEFNHAVNSIANEIKWNDEEVSLRTGLSYIHFFRSDINKVKSRSKDITLEEIINTKQTEDIINIINSFNNYSILNEEFANTLYSLKHDIDDKGYKSNAYFFQSYICKELMKNRTFIPTIENLRFKGNVDDIEKWFDDITNVPGSYNKLTSMLDEILKEEAELNKVKWFKKYKINKIRAKSRQVLDIVAIFDKNCIYK